MRQIALCLAAAASLLAGTSEMARAQDLTVLRSGARVRLITPRLEASHQTVTVISASSDSVAFRSGAHPVTRTLAISEITAVEVRSYGERPFLRNMLIGGALGGGIGAIAAAATYKECDNCWYYDSSRGKDAIGGAILGGLTGVLSGIAIAAFQRGERWTRIPLNANVALLPTPSGRFAFTLTRGF